MAAAAPSRPPAPLRATAPAVDAVTPLVVLVGGLFVPKTVLVLPSVTMTPGGSEVLVPLPPAVGAPEGEMVVVVPSLPEMTTTPGCDSTSVVDVVVGAGDVMVPDDAITAEETTVEEAAAGADSVDVSEATASPPKPGKKLGVTVAVPE